MSQFITFVDNKGDFKQSINLDLVCYIKYNKKDVDLFMVNGNYITLKGSDFVEFKKTMTIKRMYGKG